MLAVNPIEFECPFCHHHGLGVAPVEVLSAIKANGIRRRILNMLIEAYPKGINRRLIELDIYSGVKGGGPLSATHVLCNTITDLRGLLAGYGWTIPSYVGSGNLYRISPALDRRSVQEGTKHEAAQR